MKVIKCPHCNREFVMQAMKKNYSYKLKEYKTGKVIYFCSYGCMQAERNGNAEQYARGRD